MINQMPNEYQVRLIIETHERDARRREVIRLARAGQARRIPGAGLVAGLLALSERAQAAVRPGRRMACQPGMAC